MLAIFEILDTDLQTYTQTPIDLHTLSFYNNIEDIYFAYIFVNNNL